MGLGELLLRLGTAALLGSLIGLERQRHDKVAGLRTHMLVSVGSALIMIVSAYGFDRVIEPGRIVLDPSRVAAQVVSGIGFLGAGTIVVRRHFPHGLTTAASVWAVAAIGLAAGGALYLAATSGAVLMLVILSVVKVLEDRLLGQSHWQPRTVTLDVTGPFVVEQLESQFHGAGLEIVGLRVREGKRPGDREIEVACGTAPISAVLRLADELQGLSGVREVSVQGR